MQRKTQDIATVLVIRITDQTVVNPDCLCWYLNPPFSLDKWGD